MDEGTEAIDEESADSWTNWSGSLTVDSQEIARPESEEELRTLVRRCAEEGRRVRVVGSGL